MTTPSKEPDSNRTEQFVRMFAANQRLIHGFILSLVPNWSDADDILQETSAVMWRKFDEFKPGTDFAAWGTTVARFQVLKFREKKRAMKVRFCDDLVNMLADEVTTLRDEIDTRHDALRKCLGGLREEDRKLIELRYGPGGTTKLVATRVGRSADAIYKALNRIHHALLECIRTRLIVEERQ